MNPRTSIFSFVSCLASFALVACQNLNLPPSPGSAIDIPTVDVDAQLSPDGKTLSVALLGWGYPSGQPQTLSQYLTAAYLFDPNSGVLTHRQLEISQYPQHLWSPNSENILYEPRNASGLAVRQQQALVGQPFAKEACQPLNSGFNGLSWSSDSSQVACAVVNAQSHWEVQIVDAASGALKQKLDTGISLPALEGGLLINSQNLMWTSENTLVLSEKQDARMPWAAALSENKPAPFPFISQNRFIHVDLAAQSAEVIHTETDQVSHSLALSPDQSALLYDSLERSQKRETETGAAIYQNSFDTEEQGLPRSQIYRFDLNTRSKTVLTEGFQPRWSPDGQQVVFLRGAERDLYVMQADGSGVQKWVSKSSLGQRGIAKFWWAGEKLLAFVVPDHYPVIGFELGIPATDLGKVQFLEIDPQTQQTRVIDLKFNRVLKDLKLGEAK